MKQTSNHGCDDSLTADKLPVGDWAVLVSGRLTDLPPGTLCYKGQSGNVSSLAGVLLFPFDGKWSSAPSGYVVRRLNKGEIISGIQE